MALFPPPTNDAYEGRLIAAWALGLVALATMAAALIHLFLPDGGAGVIAGLDLEGAGAQIPGLFAWAGATQLVWGLMLLLIVLRHRALVPVALALLLAERTLHALNMWVLKGAGGGHHPPEAYVTLVSVPIIAIFLILSLQRRG